MMRQYELVERVQSYDPGADEALLNRAYVYAMKAHGHQTRRSGDPYFSHPLEVAAILTDLKLDAATIATALLHDVIEDTDATRAEIDQLFGSEIGALVDGLTKIRRLDLVTKKAQQAESFRKLLIAISSDIRVLLVKLADRLHNMRTMEHMKPASRQRISEETLDIYAPLAGRMGMQALRDELETLAFQWLNPEAFQVVDDKLKDLRDTNAGLVEEICTAMGVRLKDVGLDAEVSGREKRPYAIWRKMENKQISLEQLSDIYAFRVVVDDVPDCYKALGVVHTTWNAVPGRFKEYVSTPKPNGYQSIHTTVVGPRYQRVELQFRTGAMHHIAEYGVASHAFYKDHAAVNGGGAVALDRDSGPYTWLRKLVETLLEGANSEEFLEHTKLELFQDQVFCFTPKGRLIALPSGASPLDFAYAVHTDVGNGAIGAYVNGRHVPIDTKLGNGDEVDVITSKVHTHPAAWEGFAVTGRARSAIRRATRDAVRRQYAGLGRELLTKAFVAAGYKYREELVEDALPRLASGQKTPLDLLASIGRSEIDIRDVMRACLPGVDLENALVAKEKPSKRVPRSHRWGRRGNLEGWFNLSKVMGLKFNIGGRESRAGNDDKAGPGSANGGSAIPIRGLKDDLPVMFESCGAVPGDRIVGVLVPNEGIRIFQVHSPRLRDFEHADWIDVTWDIDPDNRVRFTAGINVITQNEPGTLAQIAQLIAEEDGNIDHLKMVNRGVDFTEMRLDIEVWDLSHLNHILKGLRSKNIVSSAERAYD